MIPNFVKNSRLGKLLSPQRIERRVFDLSRRHPADDIPTGVDALDIALGGGLPRGCAIVLRGPSDSGKTTIAGTALAAAQGHGECCAVWDGDRALTGAYGEQLGVDTSALVSFNSDQLPGSSSMPNRRALTNLIELVRTGRFGLIVLDAIDLVYIAHHELNTLFDEITRTRTVLLVSSDHQAPTSTLHKHLAEVADSHHPWQRLFKWLRHSGAYSIELGMPKREARGRSLVPAKVSRFTDPPVDPNEAVLEITLDEGITADRIAFGGAITACHLRILDLIDHGIEQGLLVRLGRQVHLDNSSLGHYADLHRRLHRDPELLARVQAHINAAPSAA